MNAFARVFISMKQGWEISDEMNSRAVKFNLRSIDCTVTPMT